MKLALGEPIDPRLQCGSGWRSGQGGVKVIAAAKKILAPARTISPTTDDEDEAEDIASRLATDNSGQLIAPIHKSMLCRISGPLPDYDLVVLGGTKTDCVFCSPIFSAGSVMTPVCVCVRQAN